jgi:hypothetical protein
MEDMVHLNLNVLNQGKKLTFVIHSRKQFTDFTRIQ